MQIPYIGANAVRRMTYPSSEHQISQPDTQKPETASRISSGWRFKPVTWITNRLTLQKKIFLAYAVAVGITVGGTGFGLSIGNSWVDQSKSRKKRYSSRIKIVK